MKIALFTTGTSELSWALIHELSNQPEITLKVFCTRQLGPTRIQDKLRQLVLQARIKLRTILLHEIHPDIFFPPSSNKVIFQPDVNSRLNVDTVRAFQPDVILISGTKRVSRDILESAPVTANLHHGFLPSYRGTSSMEFVIREQNFNYLAVSLHEVDDTLDTGRVFTSTYVTPYFKESLELFKRRLFLAGVDLVLAFIENPSKFPGVCQSLALPARMYRHKDKGNNHAASLKTAFYSKNLYRYSFWQRYRSYAQSYWSSFSTQQSQFIAKRLALKGVIRYLRRPTLVPGLYILTYHDICDDEIAHICNRERVPTVYTGRTNFASHLEFLSNEFCCAPLFRALEMWRNGEVCDSPIVAITFDDGLKGAYFAVNELVDFNLTPTFFLCGNPILNNRPVLVHKQYLIQKYLCNSGANHQDLDFEFDEMLANGFVDVEAFTNFVRGNYLDLGDVKKLVRNNENLMVGSHTLDHSSLQDDSIESQRDKIVNNHLNLKEHFGNSLRYFSYPFGKLDRRSFISEYLAHEIADNVFECNGGINLNPDLPGGLARIGIGDHKVDELRRILSIQWTR
jgi:peptidoglycan/xylan/chitin deacetylase (PgdA/CDA1 family)